MWSVEIILVCRLNLHDSVNQSFVCAWGVWVAAFSINGKLIFSSCSLAILRVVSFKRSSSKLHEWLIWLHKTHQRWESFFKQSISFNFSSMNFKNWWYSVGIGSWNSDLWFAKIGQWGERLEWCWAWCLSLDTLEELVLLCLNSEWLLHVWAVLHHFKIHHASCLLWSLRSILFLILALLKVVDAWYVWCVTLVNLLESVI